MLRKIRKTSIFAITLGIALIPMVSSAYSINNYSWSNVSSVSYKWGNNLQTDGTLVKTAFQTAVSDWNTTPTKVSFFYSSGSANTLNTINVQDDTLYGQTNTTFNNNVIQYFNANLNVGNLNITTNNVARSTSVHELGHGLGLADTTSSPAIMNSNRDRTIIYTPQQDDINGINAKYGL